MHISRIYWLIILLSGLSCGSAMYKASGNEMRTRMDMIDALRSADTIAIIYGANDATTKQVVADLQQQTRDFGMDVFIWSSDDQHADMERMSSYPVYLIGTASENIYIQQFQNELPYKVMNKGFMFDNKQYTDASDILKIAMYPNPKNYNMPLTVILANSINTLSAYIAEAVKANYGYFFWESWGYQVLRDNKRVVLGYFSEDSSKLWSIDKKKHWEFDYKGHLLRTNNYFSFIDHNSGITEKQLDSLDAYTTRNFEAIEQFTDKKISTRFTYHLYPSTEIKGLMLDNTDQSNINYVTGEVHGVYENEFHENYSGMEMHLACRNLLDSAQLRCLETGMATMFNDKWCEHGYKFWAMKLYRSGNMPSLAEIVDNAKFASGSPYLFDCTAAMLIEFLTTTQPADTFLEKYSDYTALDIMRLTKQWEAFLMQEEKKFPDTAESIGFKKQDFIKGFNFAHEGYQIYNGYLGSSAAESLQELQSIGANAISIIPYGFMRDLNKPYSLHFAQGAGTENDESVIRSAYIADQLNMSAMLKPQLWPRNGWTGDIAMQNAEDWKLFFQYYYEWIIHYAFMAELYHFDFFCIGVEFQNATLTHEKEWREIFSKVRALYSGKITYAANWGNEFENVTFWDQLDYICINCYYPLSDKQDVTDAELKNNFEQILDKIEVVQKKYNKPLLFTEIGFKSIDYPWLQPHADADEQEYNEVSQKRCYNAIFEALHDEDWVAGMYLWQWPSYMEYVQYNPKGFTPCGKLAEEAVKYWYGIL